MLDIDVAGVASVGEGGIEIERAPDGITFEPLDRRRRAARHARRRRRQVHRAQRRAAGSTACSSACRRASSSSKPLYVRIANSADGGSLFWRLLVVAEEGAASR